MDTDNSDILDLFPGAQPLGGGGQREAYTVEHEQYGSCVLKIGCCPSTNGLERLRREFQVLKSLDNPHFPEAYEFEILDDQRFWTLEQLLAGCPLADRITEFADFGAATDLVWQLISGLTDLWQRRVVHRDVKPGNLIVSPEDHLYIIDLGIARLLDETSLTHSFLPRGPHTPWYASPEQLENRKNEINHRCDQFACAIVYAQLILGGAHPFDPTLVGEGDSIQDNLAHGRWAQNAVIAAGGAEAVPILKKMLGVEPYLRYRKIESLERALRTLYEKDGK